MSKSFRTLRLIAALKKAGHTNIRVRWEPLGPALEMCGHSGGYFFSSDQQRGVNPIGTCLAMALDVVSRSYQVRYPTPKATAREVGE